MPHKSRVAKRAVTRETGVRTTDKRDRLTPLQRTEHRCLPVQFPIEPPGNNEDSSLGRRLRCASYRCGRTCRNRGSGPQRRGAHGPLVPLDPPDRVSRRSLRPRWVIPRWSNQTTGRLMVRDPRSNLREGGVRKRRRDLRGSISHRSSAQQGQLDSTLTGAARIAQIPARTECIGLVRW